jgi:hypothetical protein
MHPIERLRHVARAEGAGPSLLAREAAGALASIGDDPAGLVTGCRRLVSRHVAAGPLWWLAARVLAAGDPVAEAWDAADELDADPTPATLAACLPDDVTVTLVGWPEQAAAAVQRRADLEVLVVDAWGAGGLLARRLAAAGVEAVAVPQHGLAAAVLDSRLVVLEASALGPTGLVAAVGSRAAAAVARHAGVPVWAVAGVGRVLPGRLWQALVERLDAGDDPWEREDELVPLDLVDQVVGPGGPGPAADAPGRADCPVAAELLREVGPS